MTDIVTTGRTDIHDFFEKSGNFDDGVKLRHTPFFVFDEQEEMIYVRIVDKAGDLLLYPDETKVMGQWQGNYRSDVFRFSVGEYRKYAEKKKEPLCTTRNVVRTIGPLGDFRGLDYEYTRPDEGTLTGLL